MKFYSSKESNIDLIAPNSWLYGPYLYNFTIGKYEGPKIQIAIFFTCGEIFSFRKKRWLRCHGNFYISFTCKNDPGPPYRLKAHLRGGRDGQNSENFCIRAIPSWHSNLRKRCYNIVIWSWHWHLHFNQILTTVKLVYNAYLRGEYFVCLRPMSALKRFNEIDLLRPK